MDSEDEKVIEEKMEENKKEEIEQSVHESPKIEKEVLLTQEVIEENTAFNEEFEKKREKLFLELNENGLNNNDLVTNYPNKSSLVINAILAWLSDDNSFVQRNTLDFMYSHLKLGFELFNDQEKKVI